MNIKKQKIIAREFLFLLAVMAIGLLAFAGTYIFNAVKRVQIKSIENNITSQETLVDSLVKNDIQNQQSNEIVQNYQKQYSKIENIKSSILPFNEQISFALKTMLVIFIVVFALRYFFYAVKWSINTLKE